MVYRSITRNRLGKSWSVDRISLLKIFLLMLFLIILGRLFQLQVLDYQQYSTYAQQRMKDKIIDARRGRILLKDGDNGFFELANNVSLELLYADPYLIEENIKEKQKLAVENLQRAAKLNAPTPADVARELAPLLFDMIKEQSTLCDQNVLCINQLLDDSFFSEKRAKQADELKQQLILNPELKAPELTIHTEPELLQEYITDLTLALSKTQRDFVSLKINVGEETIQKIQELNLPGVGTTVSSVWANPLVVTDAAVEAKALEDLLGISAEDLAYLMSQRPNRYVKIKNRIDFQTAEKIRALKISSLGFYEEHWRNYAEQEDHPFAPQVIGFLDNSFNPMYGIEKSMNDLLSGKTGHIRGEVDLRGRTLTSRSSEIEEAVNGADIVLTIDQVIQNKVEELLEERVKASRAESGQVIIQDPSTGAILAMAAYPTFNPNHPGSAYEKEPIDMTQDQIDHLQIITNNGEKRYFLYLNPGYKLEIFKQGDNKYFRYKNLIGIGAYRNPMVSNIYEPGSVFKAIVMAAAIDSKEVRPSDVFHDTAPLKVDCHNIGTGVNKHETCDYTIKNSTHQYFGLVTMTQIIEKSLNTGMAFVAKKLGPSLMYDYLKNFGFGEKTFIELSDENNGKMPHYRNWVSESDMITKAFGQGIATTPLQIINAFSAVVNGGLLMQPTLIAGTLDENGQFIKNEPKIVRRVISASSSEVMKSMLVSSVLRGYAKGAGIAGYRVGGKTGTSQIATNGLYEKGPGTTVASYAGFAPYDHPRFVILVKVDRPLSDQWGVTNAVPLAKTISDFLVNYLQIPPDDPDNLPVKK